MKRPVGGMEIGGKIQEGKKEIIESKGVGASPIGLEGMQETAAGLDTAEIQQVGAAEERSRYVSLSSLLDRGGHEEEVGAEGEAGHQNAEIQQANADEETGLLDVLPEETASLLRAEMHPEDTASHLQEEHLWRWLWMACRPKALGVFILVATAMASLAYLQQLETPFSVWFATIFVLWFILYIVIMFWPSEAPPTGQLTGSDGQV